MGFNIFGYTITKDKDSKHENKFIPSVVTPSNTDGSITVSTNVGNSGLMSGYYSYQFDVDGALRNESQMISQYRATASYPDVDTAIETIVNEAVIVEQGEPPVSINVDNLPEQYSVVKQQINDCFQRVLDVLDFNNNCHDIFKRWYIDGKLYYFVIIDPKNPKKGIIDLKYIDPRKIRKVVEYQKQNKDGIDVVVGKNEYYLFNDNGLTENGKGIKISTDSIINVSSGLIDANTGNGISYLFKAIKPTNQLKMMEDSLVIYRITRAPERRVFYVDVGKLPGPRAEQYVRNIMNKFRNKVVYDVATGEVRNTKNYQSMCEDYWLPRREGGKATEIQTLPAAQSLGELDDVVYFRNKLYQSMNVPRQRLQSDNLASIGNNNEITREEVAFSKFIQKLRNRFNVLFKEALRIQLIVSKVINQKDWESIRNNIYFEYQHDNYFEEIKRIEIFNQKVAQLATVDGYKGVYFSKRYIVDKVLGFNQDQWNEIQQQIKQEQIDEAISTAQLEQKTTELQNQDSDIEQDDDSQSEDDQYNDFVNDETPDQDRSDNETELTDEPEQQSDDATDTINDNQTPNPGEDEFTRPGEQGLKVAG